MAARRLASNHQAASGQIQVLRIVRQRQPFDFIERIPQRVRLLLWQRAYDQTLGAQHEHAFAIESMEIGAELFASSVLQRRMSKGHPTAVAKELQLFQTGWKIEAAVLPICRHRCSGNSLETGVESNGMDLVSIGAFLCYRRNFELDQGLLRSLNDLRQWAKSGTEGETTLLKGAIERCNLKRVGAASANGREFSRRKVAVRFTGMRDNLSGCVEYPAILRFFRTAVNCEGAAETTTLQNALQGTWRIEDTRLEDDGGMDCGFIHTDGPGSTQCDFQIGGGGNNWFALHGMVRKICGVIWTDA